jgi:hypothetical protein
VSTNPNKEKKAQPGAEAAFAAACAIGALIGLLRQKCIHKNSDLAWVQI